MKKAIALLIALTIVISGLSGFVQAEAAGSTVTVHPDSTSSYTISDVTEVIHDYGRVKLYRAKAPSHVTLNIKESTFVDIFYYKDGSYKYDAANGRISTGEFDLWYKIDGKSILTKEGMYRIRTQETPDSEFIQSYIFVSKDTAIATPTTANVIVDGKSVSFDAYNINGNNYFKLRDLAYVLNKTPKQFSLGYEQSFNWIYLETGKEYIPLGTELGLGGVVSKDAIISDSLTFKNERLVVMQAYNIDGYNYFKLRDLGAAVDFGVEWNGSSNTIKISTSTGYTPE